MDTLGEQFRKAREKRGVSQSEAAASTHIKIQHIDAMERDDFSQIAAVTYARGFIKIYAEYLGLEPAPLIQTYMQSYAPPEARLLPPEDTDAAPAVDAGEVPEREAGQPARRNPAWAPLLRVGVPVIGIVVVVLLGVRLLSGGHGEDARPAKPDGTRTVPSQPLYVAEPPPPYLPAPDRGAAIRP